MILEKQRAIRGFYLLMAHDGMLNHFWTGVWLRATPFAPYQFDHKEGILQRVWDLFIAFWRLP